MLLQTGLHAGVVNKGELNRNWTEQYA